MKYTLTDKKSELLGALIGLARASGENGMPDAGLVINALCSLSDEDDTAVCEAKHIVSEEKRRLSPDCFSCASPCGRTTDYNPDDIKKEAEKTASLKYSLIEILVDFARGLKSKDPSEYRLSLILEALFTIGYDADEVQLEKLRQGICKLNDNLNDTQC